MGMTGSTARVKIVWAKTTSATILKMGGMARLARQAVRLGIPTLVPVKGILNCGERRNVEFGLSQYPAVYEMNPSGPEIGAASKFDRRQGRGPAAAFEGFGNLVVGVQSM